MASMGNAQRGALGSLAKLGEGARTTSDLSRVGGGLSRGANEGKKLNAAPWSDTFPAAGATLDLDFANNRGFVRGVGQGGVMDAITFTRASTGWYVDEDGLLQEADNGEPRFDWASTEQVAQRNLLTFSEQFNLGNWNLQNINAFGSGSVINTLNTADPLGGNTAEFIQENTATNTSHYVRYNGFRVGGTSVWSCYAKAAGRNYCYMFTRASKDTGDSCIVDLTTGQAFSVTAGASVTTTDVGDGWWRISIASSGISTPSLDGFLLIVGAAVGTGSNDWLYTGNGTDGIYIWGAQLELGNTATEYQAVGSSIPSTTPLRANPTSNGILIEEARTNRLLWNRDATQTEWVKTNITAAKDQTGIDGVANAASTITATDDNGTCIQTITLGAGNRTGSVYLKRLTGTGNVQVTLDGSTYSTVELSDTEWYRIVLSGNVTNPTVGIKIAVDGDAVAMDYGQVEDGLFATSPILTTTATATRSGEISQILQRQLMSIFKADVSSSANEMSGTFFAEIVRGGYQSSSITYQYLTLNNAGVAISYFLLSNRADNGGGLANNPVGLSMMAYVPLKVAVAFDIRCLQEESAINGIVTDDKRLIHNTTSAYDRLAILNNGRSVPTIVPQGYIKRLVYFPQVMGANSMEALTR